MRPIFAKILILVGAASFLASCATTSLVDTWRNPGIPGVRFHKVLVVSITRIEEKRRFFEDVLANELRANGAESVPSYTLIPTEGKPDRQTLAKAVKEAGADAVLTVQTVRVEERVDVQPGYFYSDYWYPWQWYPGYPSWGYYGEYGMAPFYEPPYISTYEVASIQVNLFEARTDSLIWAANLQTSEPGKIVTLGKDLARLVVQALVKAGLI